MDDPPPQMLKILEGLVFLCGIEEHMGAVICTANVVKKGILSSDATLNK